MSSESFYVFDMANLSVDEALIVKKTAARVYVDKKLSYSRTDATGGNWFHRVEGVGFDAWSDTDGRKAVVCAYGLGKEALVEAVREHLRVECKEMARVLNATSNLLAKFNDLYKEKAK